LRSQAWFGGADKVAFIHRSWMKNSGLPVDAFDALSEPKPCDAHCRGADVPRESH
jgi:L-arabonate dehydrase